jgi:hypothetical protein
VITFCFSEHIGKTRDARVLHIPFEAVVEWIVTARTPCWRENGLGARSAHQQWDDMIREIWECGDPRTQRDNSARISDIMAILGKKDDVRGEHHRSS